MTEIYAVAVEAHVGFASEVFKLAGLPAAETYEAFTQRRFPEVTGRLDLYVVGRDHRGAIRSFLYAEHKEPGGRASEGQRNKYLPALRAEIRTQRAEGKLLWIVGQGDDPDRGDRRRRPARVARTTGRVRRDLARAAARRPGERVDRTWQDVANCAEIAGRASAAPEHQSQWREAAMRPSAPASQRVLREFVWYLEEKGYAVAKGITDKQLAEAASALETLEAVQALLEATIEKLTGRKVARFTVSRSRATGSGYLKLSPDTSWIDRWAGRVSLGYDAGDTSRRPGHQKLTFWLEVGLSRQSARLLSERSRFREQLDEQHLDFDFDDGCYVATGSPVDELIAADGSETQDRQAERLADWAQKRLAVVLALKPGPRPRTHSSRA